MHILAGILLISSLCPCLPSRPLASLVQDPPPASGQPTAARPPVEPGDEPEGIQDNSFLIEEAYNQEPGVVQHINTLQRDLRGANWVYSFTQEWPVPGEQHQLSFSVPIQALEASPDGSWGVGDIALNYRYQLVGSGDTRVAVAPRLSILLPTGNAEQSRGAGGVSYQAALPVSVVLNQRFVTHFNAGITASPHARNASGESASTVAFDLGQSVVWLLKPTFNAMLEVVYLRSQSVAGPGITEASDAVTISPGIRWAYNFKNGLQVVPGIAVPLGVGPSAGQRAVFLYLSFEHPMFTPRRPR